MKIARWKDYHEKFVIEEMPKPEVRRGEVLIRVKSCGVSGTDVYRYDDRHTIDIKLFEKGETPGHEVAGVVEKVGKGSTLKPGNRVVVQPFWGCGKCRFCSEGFENRCRHIQALGFHIPGGLAEYIKVPGHVALKIPPEISFDEATLVHHIAVVYYALINTGIKIIPRITGAVFGIGNLGLLLIQLLQYLGMKKIFMVDVNEPRLALAKSLVKGRYINPRIMGDPVSIIVKETGGMGVDFSVDTAGGNAPTLEQAIRVLKKGGVFAGVGVRDNKDTINFMTLMAKEIRVQGNAAHTLGEMRKSLKAMQAGGVRVKKFITHTFPLEKVNEAFEVRLRDEKAISVMVNP
jgi:threonine dehydrogenase-like Zn-dependent dehydrogenase